MGEIVGPGAPPPRIDSRIPGDTEVASMVRDPELAVRRIRVAGMASLVTAVLIGGASLASARTAPLNEGPSPQGDPTADDQPSPTPKQNRSGGVISIQQIDHHGVNRGGRPHDRLIWLSYVRVLIRISTR